MITGAGSGIGRALARTLAARGARLALADINVEGLEETKALVSATATKVSTHKLDVADRTAVANLPEEIISQHQGVDVLINNAGVALGGSFEQTSEADFDWLMEINFHGLVRMTRAFLPLLRKSDEAALVNLSSLYGLVSPPGQCAYSASKFAVRGFSNALRHELAGSKISVTVVHPGGVATSIARSARAPANASAEEIAKRRAKIEKMLKLSPEQAAEEIVSAVEKKKGRVIIGSDAKLLSWIERIAPVDYWKILEVLYGVRGS